MPSTEIIPAQTNASTLSGLQQATAATGSTDTAQAVGKAMAFQMVSQATGMLVEDAAAFLRNVTQIGLAMVSVASEKYVQSEGLEVNWLLVIQQAFNMIEQATTVFTTIATAAGETLSQFPA